MPQMSPMLWLILYIYFLLVLMLIIMIIYNTVIDYVYNMSMKKFKKFFYNLKW